MHEKLCSPRFSSTEKDQHIFSVVSGILGQSLESLCRSPSIVITMPHRPSLRVSLSIISVMFTGVIDSESTTVLLVLDFRGSSSK